MFQVYLNKEKKIIAFIKSCVSSCIDFITKSDREQIHFDKWWNHVIRMVIISLEDRNSCSAKRIDAEENRRPHTHWMESENVLHALEKKDEKKIK